MRVNPLRVILAFIIVPLFPAALVMPPVRDENIWLLTFGVSYLVFLLFGLPLYFMLKAKDGLRAAPVAFGGVIVGGIVGIIFAVMTLSSNEEFGLLDAATILAIFVVLGVVTAFIWWVIAIWSYNKSPQPTAKGGG